MSANILQATQQNYQQEVLQAQVPVVVDFWAPWCGPCRMLAPELEKVATRLGARARVVKVNVDDQPALAAQWGVMGIPTVLVFHQGREVGRHVGYVGAEALATAVEGILP